MLTFSPAHHFCNPTQPLGLSNPCPCLQGCICDINAEVSEQRLVSSQTYKVSFYSHNVTEDDADDYVSFFQVEVSCQFSCWTTV